MAEYIDRGAFQATLVRKQCGPANKRYTEGWNDCLLRVKSMVSKASSADVAPGVHGRWEPGNPICPVCGEDKFKDLDADIWCDWMQPFCPNCGAKMDEGVDHRA